MAKDPAVLFYIDKWLLATKEMKPDCKSWYHSLILHQFDKKSLPNDIEELANLADVRISEFERFKQVFEEVLKLKFKENKEGRLVNEFALEIITNREQFKDKRSNAGKMSYFAKFMRNICNDENIVQYVLKNTNFNELDTKNEQMLKQVFKQKSELYISVNVNESINTSNKENNIKELTENETLVFNDVCFYFGYFDVNFINQRYLISCFIFSLRHKGKSEFFTKQFEFYKKLKQLDGYKHSLENFIGRQSEQFLDGKWDDNWEQKLKEFKIKNQTQNNSGRILN